MRKTESKRKRLLTGRVVKGSGDGRKLGYPTANIEPVRAPILRHGVYAVTVKVLGQLHYGVLHWGPRLVFGETRPQWEVYILDFDRDIYGEEIVVSVGPFIRLTEHFSSVTKLKARISGDVKAARRHFGNAER